MATVTGVVEVAMNPNKYGKFAINVNGTWYSTDPAWIENKPNKGDTVSFDNGGEGKKYIKNLRIVGKGSPATASSLAKSGGYSSLGVELGHASNIAKDMANRFFDQVDIGNDLWYKFWMEHTQRVYNTMKALREKYEHPLPASTDPSSDVTVLTSPSKPSSEVEDIFA